MTKRKASKRKEADSDSKQEAAQEAEQLEQVARVAMGTNCITCGLPLQIAESDEQMVLASLHRTGLVWLLCVCGQMQLVGYTHQTDWHHQNQ